MQRSLASALSIMIGLLGLLAGSCGRSYPAGPLDRPILALDAAAARTNQGLLPAGFPGPKQTACGPDTTRAFIGELADHPPDQAKVPLHWAPVVPGPVEGKATVEQPELFAEGTVSQTNRSDLDTSFDHPVGFDLNLDIALDAPFTFLADNHDAQNHDLHTELESGFFADGFGFQPQVGDRVVARGAWIFDCGHPAYETELHPPSFLALARAQDPRTTVALALALPWRTTQLYGAVTAVADFAGDPFRLRNQGEPFPRAFLDEIILAAATAKDHLELHALLEAPRFQQLAFTVCAPSPRPAKASLRFSHRFALRSGVALAAVAREDQGCVDYTLSMGAAYVPPQPNRTDRVWPWATISAQASGQSGQSLDVRQLIIGSLRSAGLRTDGPAFLEAHPPVIDAVAPLVPRADAAQDSPSAVAAGADDQPYPFAGRVRVWWE